MYSRGVDISLSLPMSARASTGASVLVLLEVGVPMVQVWQVRVAVREPVVRMLMGVPDVVWEPFMGVGVVPVAVVVAVGMDHR